MARSSLGLDDNRLGLGGTARQFRPDVTIWRHNSGYSLAGCAPQLGRVDLKQTDPPPAKSNYFSGRG
jgi:hypothetical protein